MNRLENVSKIYRKQNDDIRALDDIEISVKEGEFLCVRGPSGCGKSTLLLTMGGMVRPTEGKVLVDGTDVYAISGHERAVFRARNIGFVFQMFHLIPYLSVVENVLVPALAVRRKPDRKEAEGLLERFNMTGRLRHRPAELSTGERQRVAMARALLNKPKLILADEPTGNLDPNNAGEVMDYLAEFHSNGGTVVVVTHEEFAEKHAQRVVHLRDGKIDTD